MRPTSASESGSWPTPSANLFECRQEVWEARREREKAKGRNGNGFGLTLAMAVQERSGLWPTPSASDGLGGRNEAGAVERAIADGQTDFRTLSRPSGAKAALSLRTAAVLAERGLFPTPTVRDSNTYAKVKRGSSAMPGGTPLVMAVSPEGAPPNGGQLNPPWVEWLMGFPIGWTDLEGSETPSSRRSSSGSDAA